MKNTYLFTVLTAILLSGCDSSLTLSDFEDRVRRAAGSAMFCGKVGVDDSTLDANTCLAQAFSDATEAYGLFQTEGVDSQVANGIITRNSNVIFYSFDSDPTGGGSTNNGEITVIECNNPSLSGVLDGSPTSVFLCDR